MEGEKSLADRLGGGAVLRGGIDHGEEGVALRLSGVEEIILRNLSQADALALHRQVARELGMILTPPARSIIVGRPSFSVIRPSGDPLGEGDTLEQLIADPGKPWEKRDRLIDLLKLLRGEKLLQFGEGLRIILVGEGGRSLRATDNWRPLRFLEQRTKSTDRQGEEVVLLLAAFSSASVRPGGRVSAVRRKLNFFFVSKSTIASAFSPLSATWTGFAPALVRRACIVPSASASGRTRAFAASSGLAPFRMISLPLASTVSPGYWNLK